MNEGWACFWHYTLLNHMYDQGKLSDKFMFEFLHSHTSVVSQQSYNSNYYSGINPYALGLKCSWTLREFVRSQQKKTKSGFQA